jgi:hypothetical protein
MLGIAAELIEGLRIEIAKIWMFAQHSQFAGRKRPRYSFIVFGHPIIQPFRCPSSTDRAAGKAG